MPHCVQLERMLLSLLPSHSVNLRTSMWMPGIASQGKLSRAEGPPAMPSISRYTTLSNLCRCTAARPRLSELMPSTRCVIESHTRPILPVAVAAAMARRRGRARVCTKINGPWGWRPNLHVALWVTDALLVTVHHWGAAFPNMVRSPFPGGICNTPTCQKKSHKSRRCAACLCLG